MPTSLARRSGWEGQQDDHTRRTPPHSVTPTRARIEAARTASRPQGQRLPRGHRVILQDAFLAAFVTHWTVMEGCALTGVSRQSVYRWIHDDATFAARFREAEREVADRILAETWRRGVVGWEEPLVHNGQPILDACGRPVTIRRYSDRCLISLLRLRVPEYRHVR